MFPQVEVGLTLKRIKRALISSQFLRKNSAKHDTGKSESDQDQEKETSAAHLTMAHARGFRFQPRKNDQNDVPPAIGPDHQIEVRFDDCRVNNIIIVVLIRYLLGRDRQK